MARQFTQSQPNIIAGGQPASASGLVKGIQAREQQKQDRDLRRVEYAKQFDLAQEMTGQHFQEESSGIYKDIIDTQTALQDATLAYGPFSEQARSLEKVYRNKIVQYKNFNQTGKNLQASLDAVAGKVEELPFADKTSYKGAIYKKIKEGGLMEKFQNGEYASTEEMMAEAMILEGEEANSVYDQANITSAMGKAVDELKTEVSEFYSQNLNGEDPGATINKKTFSFLKEFTAMDGNRPRVNEDGTIMMNLTDQNVNRLMARTDPTGNMLRSFNYAYENQAEEGESKTDFFNRYTEFDKMLPGDYQSMYKETPGSVYDRRSATQDDFYNLDKRVTNIQKLIQSGNQDKLKEARSLVTFFTGLNIENTDVTDVEVQKGEPVPEVTDDDYQDWLNSPESIPSKNNFSGNQDDFSDYVESNKDAYVDQVKEYVKKNSKGEVKEKYKDRIVLKGRNKDGIMKKLDVIDLTDPGSHQKMVKYFMQSDKKKFNPGDYLRYTDEMRNNRKDETEPSDWNLDGINLNE